MLLRKRLSSPEELFWLKSKDSTTSIKQTDTQSKKSHSETNGRIVPECFFMEKHGKIGIPLCRERYRAAIYGNISI